VPTIEHSVDVNVPVETADNQWTQFEDFLRFMEGVEEVRQLGVSRPVSKAISTDPKNSSSQGAARPAPGAARSTGTS
jgi:hypothetical protein